MKSKNITYKNEKYIFIEHDLLAENLKLPFPKQLA